MVAGWWVGLGWAGGLGWVGGLGWWALGDDDWFRLGPYSGLNRSYRVLKDPI